MRVCHVVYSFFPFDPRVRKEVEALTRAGHQVDVIAVMDYGEVALESVNGVVVHRIQMPIVRGGKWRYAYQYMRFLLSSSILLLRIHFRQRFQLVHVHSLPDFQVFCTLPIKLSGVPVVLDLHELFPEIMAARFRLRSSHWLIRVARVIERLSCLYSSKVIAVTEQRARILRERGVDRSKLVVVMNSPDVTTHSRLPLEAIRAELNVRGHLVLIQAGGINPERDLETLLRAAQILAQKRLVSLLLFGKGDSRYRQHLKEFASREAFNVDFRLSEWVPPKKAFAYVSASAIGLGTYERNPLTEIAAPHKVFEYVAARRPLVLANLSGLRTMWESAALFYEPGDEQDLAAKIDMIVGNDSLASELVEAASAILQRTDSRASREVLLNVYEELAAESG